MPVKKNPKPKLDQVMGQPSWQLVSDCVEAHVTRTGGMLGPVSFGLPKGRRIEPYAVAPWAQEELPPGTPPVVAALRGDFFCMPFGGNATTYRGESHPVHGETANADWKLESLEQSTGAASLHASLVTRVRQGRVDKYVTLRQGHTVTYQRHEISGMSGRMGLGHHAMLRFPDQPGSGIVSTSPFIHGQVYPGFIEDPAIGGYQCLKPGSVFKSLSQAQLLGGGRTDLSAYPARPGFEDLVMMVAYPNTSLAWTAVTFPKQRYVWFSLKDPRKLASTILWFSNGGRHYPPWSGRHRSVMGLEDVTSYFHTGIAESAKINPLSRDGHPTAIKLKQHHPTSISYVQGVAAIPSGFDRVAKIMPADDGRSLILLSSKDRYRSTIRVDMDWMI